ncbi:MAG: peptidoglycan DD-metalloendopeptidase family protein [Methylovulum sp.]|nr:peptidoglycan DD-metalloendopeptidase family protein [Methylovulum sp.]
MKNKFYKSLAIGISLAIASTSSYARPAHTTSKKHPTLSAKHSKKHPVVSVKTSKKQIISKIKHSKSTAHSNIISHVRNSGKKQHPLSLASKHHTLSKKKTIKHNHQYLAKALPTESFSNETIGDANEHQRVNLAPPIKINARIHSFIVTGGKDTPVRIEQPHRVEIPHRYISTHGIINTSLSAAGQKAGLSDELIMQLTNIFAWDIDFATKLRRGDQFTVVYENNSRTGEHIIAAEFVNQGKILTAVKYQDNDGNTNYYTPEGKVMRKAFLSTPVDFARISSHFDTNRKHPILNRIRAHKGVDYAARTGTPVKAAGDGEISFLGRKGGYGQVLIIKHGERYETLYAHLSKFKNGLHDGDAIKQGEVIGYVGQTGLATGPHLHYEFHVDGVHRNPETVDTRQASTLKNDYLADFKAQAQPVLSELYHAKAQTLFAKNQLRPD